MKTKSKINPRGFRYMLIEKIDNLSYPVSRHTTKQLAENKKALKSEGVNRINSPLKILPYNKSIWNAIAVRA